MSRFLSVLAVLCLCVVVPVASHGLTFITVGDWGGVDLGGYHETNAIATAKAMGQLATTWNVSFVVNVGDNFYYNGVSSATDPQWQQDWTNTFNAPSLQIPWYGVLGNHDYAGNPDAQLNYPYDNRWVMPARSYTQRIYNPTAGEYITYVFWDNNPCISAWRANDPSGWDPNTTQFHNNIIAQDCSTIQNWLETTLSKITDRWVIAVSHVPPHEVDMFDALALYQQYGVSLALCGHTHLLEYYTITGNDCDYVISGAACMVYPEDEAKDKAELEKKKAGQHGLEDYPSPSPSPYGPTPNSQFMKRVTGLTVHEFAEDGSTLYTKFFSAYPSELYAFSTSPRNTAEFRAKRLEGKKNQK